MTLSFRSLFKRKPSAATKPLLALESFRCAEALRGQGQLKEARDGYAAVLALEPDHWNSLNAVAAIALQSGDLEGAVRSFDAVIARRGDHAEAHYKRANALNGLGRWEAALEGYDRAIALNPQYANAYCNRGTVLANLKRWKDALDSYDRTVEINRGDWLAHYNRGTVLREIARLDDALAAYEVAIGLKADYVEAHINRGNVLQEMLRHEAAVASYDTAIGFDPSRAEAFEARGSSLSTLKQFDAALASFDHALLLKPDCKFVLGLRQHMKMQICDWRDLKTDLNRIADGVNAGLAVIPPLPLLALLDDPDLQARAARIFVQDQCPPSDVLGDIPARPRRAKIKIAYFSADFRNHPVSTLVAELLECHDRSRFEITGFAFGPRSDDTMRQRLSSAFDNFIEVHDRSDVDVARLARELETDIAIDLGGLTENSRTKIFALRTAPIQVGYLGYPGTMGARYMDYFAGDRTVVSEAYERTCSEKVIFLPNSYLPNDSKRAISSTVFTRTELGLPPKGFIFCCFNNNYKFTPETFDGWMRILDQVDGSVLWLSPNNNMAADNLRGEAALRGIDPARLRFAAKMVSPEHHLARLRAADLFLDTLPYNAHATAMDALWSGLPVLTRIGHAVAGRVAASLLRSINLPELIVTTAEQYEDLAICLARDPGRLAAIRLKLSRNRTTAPLFNTRLLAASWESALVRIYERHLAKMPPESIYLPEK